MPRRSPSRDRKHPHSAPGRNKSRRSQQFAQSDKPATPIVKCPKGKTGFPEHEARKRLAQITANPDPRRPLPVRVYRCPHCDAWHLTARPD